MVLSGPLTVTLQTTGTHHGEVERHFGHTASRGVHGNKRTGGRGHVVGDYQPGGSGQQLFAHDERISERVRRIYCVEQGDLLPAIADQFGQTPVRRIDEGLEVRANATGATQGPADLTQGNHDAAM